MLVRKDLDYDYSLYTVARLGNDSTYEVEIYWLPDNHSAIKDGERRNLTIVCDVGNLKAFAAVALIGLELDPEFAGAGGEGDWPLVCLTRLIGGYGCGLG